MRLVIVLFCSAIVYGQTFEGKVIIEEDPEKPVPFALIYFVDLGSTVFADEQGNFKVANIPEGHTTIEVRAAGFEDLKTDFYFQSGQINLISLERSHRELDKVIVSTFGVLQGENITNVERIGMGDLMKIPTSIGESLSNIPGVAQGGAGGGISKPVIRGLSGNRVVTYLNGLRVENQQWGADHGLPITELGIGSVEVIKGPSSLLYGPDALGGVIYFVDEPYAPRNTISAFGQTRSEFATMSTSNMAGFKISKEKIRLNLYGGYDNYADFRLPTGQFAQNSRYSQASGKMAMGYNHKNWVMNLRYNFFHGRYGIPGHTHDSIPDYSSFQVNEQSRAISIPAQVVNNHYVLFENKFQFDEHFLMVSIGNTFNNTREFEEKITIPAINLQLNSTTYNLRWKTHLLDHKLSLIAGVQGMYQLNLNDEKAEDFLIPDAVLNDIGGYFLMVGSVKKWKAQAGIRYDHRSVETLNSFNGVEDFKRDFAGVNYSAGLARIGDKSTIRFNVSSGFRSPHTSELLADGAHHGSFRYEIGHQNLTTERATQFDFSYAIHLHDIEFVINPFYTTISNYILIEEIDSMIEGMRVFAYDQIPSAILYGGDIGFHYHPHFAHPLHIESSFSMVYGEDEDKNPLTLIPANRINTQLRFNFNKKSSFGLKDIIVQHIYTARQDRVGLLETPTGEYHLLNAGINFELEKEKTTSVLSVGGRNLLNQRYFNHLSGLKNIQMPNPGINFYISLKINFNNNTKTK